MAMTMTMTMTNLVHSLDLSNVQILCKKLNIQPLYNTFVLFPLLQLQITRKILKTKKI
jgi:hypothetical protein